MTTDSTGPLTLRAKGPEDILAAVPVVLGFAPEDSLVMMTFGGRHRFHARGDLPPDHPAALAAAVETFLMPARRHTVEKVVFALYTADARLAAKLGELLVMRFLGARIAVVDCLRVHDGRWWDALGPRAGVPAAGVPYDAAGHPFRAEAVFGGYVTLGSRTEVAAQLAADALATAEVEAALACAEPLGQVRVDAVIAAALPVGRVEDLRELAALLLTLRKPRLRDRAWTRITSDRAGEHVRLWTWVLRRSPGVHAADVGAVLGFAAWQAGDGALAWCAVDRCLEADPGHSLGGLVASILGDALPPSVWKRPAS